MALDKAVASRSILIDKTEFAAFANKFARSLDSYSLFRLHKTTITFMLTVGDKKNAAF